MKKILIFLLGVCFFIEAQAQENRLTGESVSIFSTTVEKPDTIKMQGYTFDSVSLFDSLGTIQAPQTIGDFAEPLNAFGGYGYTWSDNKETETNYRFLYLNFALGRVKASAFGLSALIWQNSAHYRYYEAKLTELAFAGFWQYYADSIAGSNYHFFSELNLGYKYVTDLGHENLYSRRQDDNMFYASLTANFFKYKGAFCRIELNSFYQKSLSYNKEAYWNGQMVQTETWKRDYFELALKVDVFTINLNKEHWRLSPRAIVTYDHEFHNHNNHYGWGVGLSLFRLYRLDWLSAVYTRKWDPLSGQTLNRVGLEFDLHSTYQVLKSMKKKSNKK